VSSGPRLKLLWDLSSLVTGQVLSTLFGFAGFAYLARALSPESYGLVEYSVGLAGLAAIVIEGGLGPIGALGISRDPNQADRLAGEIVTARLMLTVLCAPLMGLTTYFTGHDWRLGILVWLYAASLFAVPFKQDWLLQGLQRMTHVAPAQALRSAVFALGVFLLVRRSEDLIRVGVVEIVAAFTAAAYYVGAQRSVGVRMQLRPQMIHAWPLIRQGAAVGASNIVWTFMLYAPIFLVTNLAGPAQAAWLGGAQRIVYSLVSFSALYFFNLYPAIAKGLKEDDGQWELLMRSSYRLVGWLSLAVALVSTIMAREVIALAFGKAFSVAAIVFSIYVWLFPVRLLSGHARWALVAGERQQFLLAAEAIATMTLLVSGIALIPGYGAVGAAIAVVTANVVGWIAAHLFAQRWVRRMPGYRDALLPIASALGCLGLSWIVNANTVASVAIALIGYAACLQLMGGDLIGDLRRLATARRTKQG